MALNKNKTTDQAVHTLALIDPDHGPSPLRELAPHLPPLPERSVVDSEALRRFFCPRFLTDPQFEKQLAIGIQVGVPVDSQLIAEELVDETTYYAQLAQEIGAAFIGPNEASLLWLDGSDLLRSQQGFDQTQLYLFKGGVAICPRGLGPQTLREITKHLRAVLEARVPGDVPDIRIVSPGAVKASIELKFRNALLETACRGLFHEAPHQSAKGGLAAWQWLGLFGGSWLLLYGYLTAPTKTILALSLFFSLFFFFLICLRLGAAMLQSRLALGFGQKPPRFEGADRELPVYTLLVPLFKEANILPQLIRALNSLDYPKAKLDIKLLLEAVDAETIKAVRSMKLPPCYHIVIVPDALPRTKPKALNYGLALSRGSYVVIYDAEDIPDPDQLKQALAVFGRSGPDLATLQAKLNFYNASQNWLTKQFTVEYCSLFDGLLPAFHFFELPIPLGGTSNHFRRDALLETGGWDAYNVTEDADLGMRLYRRGFRSAVLVSTTYEEATSGFYSWLCQRTRWLKGWMQTYYVHMRQPVQLLRELGGWKFLGFQAIIGGPILAALAHPVFLGILIWQMPYQNLPVTLSLVGLWVLSLFNLTAGYIATMWLGVVTLRLRQLAGFAFAVITIPLYWIFISLAAYRALLQLIYAPFHWEKTHHKGQKQQP